MSTPHRLAILNSHPIQYFAPLYQRLTEERDIETIVYYCSRQGLDSYVDPQFTHEFAWDRNLLQGYQSYFLKNFRKIKQITGFWSLINFEIVLHIWQKKFDVIWIHGYGYFTHLLAILVAKMMGIPVLMRGESHLDLQRSAWKNKWHRKIVSKIYKMCSAFLAIGTKNREFYLAYGIAEKKIFTVPYTVDNQFFMHACMAAKKNKQALLQEIPIHQNHPIILYASKLISRKNPMDLLKAFHLLQAEKRDANLIFVGSGEYEGALKNYVNEYHLQNVYFLGFRNQSEMSSIYAIADIFVLPSTNEPWGLVINEAMCAGLPIVASHDIGAVKDLIRCAVNGLTYRAGDITALAEQLSQLLQQANLRQKMGEASLALIKKWDYEQCVSGLRHALEYVRNKK